MPESSRFKENDLKSDHKPVASPLAEEENASTDFGAQENKALEDHRVDVPMLQIVETSHPMNPIN
jgi:hypothetical protein